MKVFIGLSLLVALTAAEPVGFRQHDQQQPQYYLAQLKEEQAEGPYPPSGFRPAGPAFDYPQKQNGFERQYAVASAPAAAAPQSQYGSPAAPQRQYGRPAVPQRQYGAASIPQRQYGAPQEATTTQLPYTTEAEDATTTVPTEFESEPVTSVNELDDEESIGSQQQQQQQSGEYYIALPDGRLQRVQYVSRQDVEAMKYFAKIRAENVEPLRGPIYAYAPLQKLQVVPAGLQLTVAPAATAAITAEPVRTTDKLNVGPANLQIQPVTQIQYRYGNPSEVIPLDNAPLSSSYTSFNGKYQLPASESRFLLTYQ